METIKAKYAIVKTAEYGAFFTTREHSTIVIEVFKDKRGSLRPSIDTLIQDPEITVENNRVRVKGKQILFTPTLGKHRYDKRYWLVDEINKDGKRLDKKFVVEFVKYHSANKLIIEDLSKIKIGYDGLWNLIKRKKSYYLDTTKEVISKLDHLKEHAINKDRKGFFLEGWSESSLTKEYDMETNNYRLEHY